MNKKDSLNFYKIQSMMQINLMELCWSLIRK